MPSLICAAKVNLFLHILGKNSDNYHILESLVTFADFGDELSFEPSDATLSLKITGPYADALSDFDVADNLIMKAAFAFERKFDLQVHGEFKLVKNLPVASGIGGGSANAAGAMNLLLQAYDKNANVDDLLLSLGADVPVCFKGENVIMWGIGEGINEWPELPKLHAVLVNPNEAVSTTKIFELLNASSEVSAYKFVDSEALKFETPDEYVKFLRHQRNDMQAAAIGICPEIGAVLSVLNECDDLMFAQMSGSGATCFGIFASARQAQHAAEKLTKNHSNWWVKPTCFSGLS